MRLRAGVGKLIWICRLNAAKNPQFKAEAVQMVIETGKPSAAVAAQTGRASHARPICRINAG